MSGGSMDYLFSKVEDASFREDTTLRKAFRKHLIKVAMALRAIEWNDSCDGDDREEQYIRDCISNDAEMKQATEDAIKIRDELNRIIEINQPATPGEMGR